MTAKMAISGSTWQLLGRFWKHFGAIWAISFGAIWRYVGPSRRHLGATWLENGGQERQDEPKNRNRAFYDVFLTLQSTDCDKGR